MDYFNRSSSEELGGIALNCCSSATVPTSGIPVGKISKIKYGDFLMDMDDLTIDKYDKAIKEIFEQLKELKQERRSIRLGEWREFDLEAATGRGFETR